MYFLEFELTYNTWTDLTADWLTTVPLIAERGIEPGERAARIGRMTFALHNPDGRYTPGHANARPGFEAGIGVRLRASDGVTTYPLFYGRLASIRTQQTPGVPLGIPQTAITVEDDVAALERVRLDSFPLMLDAAPEDVIGWLVSRAFVPPSMFNCWRLGHPLMAVLGSGTRIGDSALASRYAAGQSVFPYVGDTWPGASSTADAIRDVCASEGGAFYLAADGTPVFEDRHARPTHISPDAALSAALGGLTIERAEARVANEVQVIAHPREVGVAGEVLWQANHAIRLLPGQPRELHLQYADPDQPVAWIGAQTVIPPEAGIDFTATDKTDGTGANLTAYIRLTLTAGATSARMVLETTWPGGRKSRPTYVHGFRLRGTPLRAFLPVIAAASDEISRHTHGRRTLSLDMPLQDNANVAQDMAAALLANRKDPHDWLEVRVEAGASAAMLTHALAREIGDRLHLTDPALALNAAPCFVEGIRHEIVRERGRLAHRVTWRTSPADWEAYWVLGTTGYAELGSAARLGY